MWLQGTRAILRSLDVGDLCVITAREDVNHQHIKLHRLTDRVLSNISVSAVTRCAGDSTGCD
jgi:hypothetical protein